MKLHRYRKQYRTLSIFRPVLLKIPRAEFLGGLLSFGILWCLASPLQAVFLAFFGSGVTGEQTKAAQHRSEVAIHYHQGSRDAMANCPRLPRDSPSLYLDHHIIFAQSVAHPKWFQNKNLMILAREELSQILAIDHNFPLTRKQSHPGYRGLSSPRPVKVSLFCHRSPPLVSSPAEALTCA